jgi:hypothetical protein
MISGRSNLIGIGAAGFEPARVSPLWLPMPVRLPVSPRPDRSSRKPAVGRGVPVPAHSPTQGQPGSRVGFTSRRPGFSLGRSHLFVPLSLGVRAGESPSPNALQFSARSNLLDYFGWSANAKYSLRDSFDCHRTLSPLVIGVRVCNHSGPKFLNLFRLLRDYRNSIPSAESVNSALTHWRNVRLFRRIRFTLKWLTIRQ